MVPVNFSPRRIAVCAALLALAGAALFAVVRVASPGGGGSEWSISIGKLPPAPLAARRDAASVWTGTEMIIWGGGNQSGGSFHADGAAYDPRTSGWRTLPAAPLGARAAAQAAWTGTEMIVWGGEDARHSPHGVTDGAAYNPRTGRWRRIASAPGSGRTGGQTLMVAGRMVVFGGSGVLGADMARTVLVYDPQADRWTTFPEPGRVVAAAAAGSTLVLALADDNGHVSVEQVDADGSGLVRGSALVSGEPVDRVGLAVDESMAYLVVLDQGRHSRVFGGRLTDGLMPAGDWVEKTTSDEVTAPHQISTGYTGLATSLGPGAVLLAGLPDVTLLDPRTGRVLVHEETRHSAGFCGVSGALVWTGRQVLGWGGQTCRAEGAALSAEGVALDVRKKGSDRV